MGSKTNGSLLLGVVVVLLIVGQGGNQDYFQVSITGCSEWTILEEIVRYDEVSSNYTYFNPNISENVVVYYNVTIPVYNNISYCRQDKVTEFTVNNSKDIFKLETYPNKYVYSWNDSVLTIKDLSRGGSYFDEYPDSCVNPGIPCEQWDYSKVKRTTLLFRSEDADLKGRVKVREK